MKVCLDKGMDDVIERSKLIAAGADGIMVNSFRKTDKKF